MSQYFLLSSKEAVDRRKNKKIKSRVIIIVYTTISPITSGAEVCFVIWSCIGIKSEIGYRYHHYKLSRYT